MQNNIQTSIKFKDLEFHQTEIMKDFMLEKMQEFVENSIKQLEASEILNKQELKQLVKESIQEKIKSCICDLIYNDKEAETAIKEYIKKDILRILK